MMIDRTISVPHRTASSDSLPWTAMGLLDHAVASQADTTMGLAVDPRAYASIEVRPVRDEGGYVVAGTRGDVDFKPSFWSLYLRDSEGLATCVADLPNDIAADRLAECLMATYPGLSGGYDIHSPIRASDEAEAAQCLWEAVLSVGAETGSPNLPGWGQAARDALANCGHAEVRLWMNSLARPCLVAWGRAEHLHGYDGECFDWVYCPEFLASLDWASVPGQCPTVDPTWLPAKVRPVTPSVVLVNVEPVADAEALPSEHPGSPAPDAAAPILRTYVIDVTKDGDIWTYEGEHCSVEDAKAEALGALRFNWGGDWADWDDMAGDVDGTCIIEHPDVMAPRLPASTVEAYRRLADGLSDMVEEGRLNEGDIPDDYQWLVEQLAMIAGLDPTRTKTVMAFGPTPTEDDPLF